MSSILAELEAVLNQFVLDFEIAFGLVRGAPPPPPGQPANYVLSSSADANSPPDQVVVPATVTFTVLVTDVNNDPVPGVTPLYAYQGTPLTGFFVDTGITVPPTDASGQAQFTLAVDNPGDYGIFVSPTLQ